MGLAREVWTEGIWAIGDIDMASTMRYWDGKSLNIRGVFMPQRTWTEIKCDMPTNINFGNTSKSIRCNLETKVSADYFTLLLPYQKGALWFPFCTSLTCHFMINAINSRTKNICTKYGTLKCNLLSYQSKNLSLYIVESAYYYITRMYVFFFKIKTIIYLTK